MGQQTNIVFRQTVVKSRKCWQNFVSSFIKWHQTLKNLDEKFQAHSSQFQQNFTLIFHWFKRNLLSNSVIVFVWSQHDGGNVDKRTMAEVPSKTQWCQAKWIWEETSSSILSIGWRKCLYLCIGRTIADFVEVSFGECPFGEYTWCHYYIFKIFLKVKSMHLKVFPLGITNRVTIIENAIFVKYGTLYAQIHYVWVLSRHFLFKVKCSWGVKETHHWTFFFHHWTYNRKKVFLF